ncbi:hypothetical protein PoB_006455300 [Plakobranchus ocellatus]|uniref:Uncharacterized protein n=1 Tax=Plakobranchus ocellatus TaxID=259542 RepID=A0AAV4D1X2_9GAST|nr:hypothetical protein PoB_006455300 [Plakobranchus ocellatus]
MRFSKVPDLRILAPKVPGTVRFGTLDKEPPGGQDKGESESAGGASVSRCLPAGRQAIGIAAFIHFRGANRVESWSFFTYGILMKLVIAFLRRLLRDLATHLVLGGQGEIEKLSYSKLGFERRTSHLVANCSTG